MRKLKKLTQQFNGDCRVSLSLSLATISHAVYQILNVFLQGSLINGHPDTKRTLRKCHSVACMTDFGREEDEKQRDERRESMYFSGEESGEEKKCERERESHTK